MFPIDFPLQILKKFGHRGDWVLDPFCGRGTTNFAARLLGLSSLGIDSSPVATAIAQAKLTWTDPRLVLQTASKILKSKGLDDTPPHGRFWQWCYQSDVLRDIVRLRSALISDCRSPERVALRAIILGALHGPLGKNSQSYFSNQNPRTFSPKPRYALSFWRSRNLRPPKLDVLNIIEKRIRWYLTEQAGSVNGRIVLGDSRQQASIKNSRRFSFVITSPPYYGMRTYVQDQWIRNWFIGGPEQVDYAPSARQVLHSGPKEFSLELRKVWENAARSCRPDAKLVIRFGGLNARDNDPLEILKQSLADTRWRVTTIKSAGNSRDGMRQSEQFGTRDRPPIPEHDIYAYLTN
jgi:SAM-dependent methyltransferase